MLDTWKDWTGARYIYMYLPDDLGLRRISFFHRQLPDDLNLFMYLVLVECHGITNKDKEVSTFSAVTRPGQSGLSERVPFPGAIAGLRAENATRAPHRLHLRVHWHADRPEDSVRFS